MYTLCNARDSNYLVIVGDDPQLVPLPHRGPGGPPRHHPPATSANCVKEALYCAPSGPHSPNQFQFVTGIVRLTAKHHPKFVFQVLNFIFTESCLVLLDQSGLQQGLQAAPTHIVNTTVGIVLFQHFCSVFNV